LKAAQERQSSNQNQKRVKAVTKSISSRQISKQQQQKTAANDDKAITNSSTTQSLLPHHKSLSKTPTAIPKFSFKTTNTTYHDENQKMDER